MFMTLQCWDEIGFGRVIYSWISCRNATLGTSRKSPCIYFVTLIWGQILHLQKSELPEGKTLVASSCHLLVFPPWDGEGHSASVDDRGPMSQDGAGSRKWRGHSGWLTMLMFKRRRSKLRFEKVEDTAAASHLLHTLTAQGIISNNDLGAGVTTTATVQKWVVKNTEICKSLTITVNSQWAEVLLKSQIWAAL